MLVVFLFFSFSFFFFRFCCCGRRIADAWFFLNYSLFFFSFPLNGLNFIALFTFGLSSVTSVNLVSPKVLYSSIGAQPTGCSF